jgi:hypothetical protein
MRKRRVSAGPVDCAHPRATQPGRAGPREMARQEKECVLGNFNRTHNVLPKIKPGIGRPCQLQAPPRIAAGSCRSPGNDKSGENMGPNRQIQTHPGLSSLNQKKRPPERARLCTAPQINAREPWRDAGRNCVSSGLIDIKQRVRDNTTPTQLHRCRFGRERNHIRGHSPAQDSRCLWVAFRIPGQT